jgi:hypothetical protein
MCDSRGPSWWIDCHTAGLVLRRGVENGARVASMAPELLTVRLELLLACLSLMARERLLGLGSVIVGGGEERVLRS